MLVSIFTPCYNRASYLDRLYQSLLNQQEKDFEWVIVDDGSVDNTEEVVKGFIAESKISILYSKQENSGKHIAINNGVKLASGDLFFVVDSDDYLTKTAVSFIKAKYQAIRFDDQIAGISGRKGYDEYKVIGNVVPYNKLRANSLDFRYKYNISGDMAEVIKLSVIKQFPFPEIKGEKFCTEGLIWSRIAKEYSFLWFTEIIYIAEYLKGGLSANSFAARKNSPKYATLYYAEHANLPIKLIYKIRANINYWRFAKFIEESFSVKWGKVRALHSLIGYPLSLIFKFTDK